MTLLTLSTVILVQLFIAVINENFDVAEELKKGKQATRYMEMQQSIQASPLWLRRLNPYRWFKANPKSIAVENLPSNLILPMQKAIIQDNSFSARSSAGSVSGLASIMFPLLFSLHRLSEGKVLYVGIIRASL